MEQKYNLTLTININNAYIEEDASVYKTDSFVKQTGYAYSVDDVLDKIGEEIIKNHKDIISLYGDSSQFEAQTDVGNNIFKFALGVKDMNSKDVVFFEYVGNDIHRSDKRFVNLLRDNFSITIRKIKPKDVALKKIYTLSFADGVNFPYLNREQRNIVTLAEGSVLVQGVAGSGKTNICIDRIVYAACMGYKGKILYSTYSRGLLIETKNKVISFENRIAKMISLLENNRIQIKGDKIKAISNKLGIWITVLDENHIISSLKEILAFLTENVDYLLISDIYSAVLGKTCKIADENFFIHNYVTDLKNYRLSGNLSKIKNLSYEIIYKEIYGMIEGSEKPISEDEYILKRVNSFSRFEAQTIYAIAQDYIKYLAQNDLEDNNTISNKLLQDPTLQKKYISVILDEVQDFTEINLTLFKYLAHKMFCVGDALQMINPSYFSFAYLKRLMYEDGIIDVKELKNNYRNTAKLEEIIENLNIINVSQFGTHSFVLKGQSIDTNVPTEAVYADGTFLNEVKKIDTTNSTFIVSSNQKKEELRNQLPKAEILTVSDIKGMERDTVVLMDVLSDNSDKWDKLYRDKVDRKTADENSAYRYWFNLMYVGISRAKRNLFIVERKNVKLFETFLKDNFNNLPSNKAVEKLGLIIGKASIDDDEIMQRINQFLSLGQYDNARYAADNLSTLDETALQRKRIDIHESDVKAGDYTTAGIKLWEIGLLDEAKEFFTLANAPELCDLVDVLQGDNAKLDASVVKYYTKLKDSEVARKIILDTLHRDISALKADQVEITQKIKEIKANNSRRK